MDGHLTLRKSEWLDDWYLIERAEHDGRTWMEPREYGAALMCSSRIGNADIEGSADEMLAIANAIEQGDVSVLFRRCAAFPADDGGWRLSSPRNSSESTLVSASQARHLAAEIRRVLGVARNTR